MIRKEIKSKHTHHNPEHMMSMKGKLLLGFLLFGAMVIAVLWFFQTVLLSDVYRSLKLRDLNKCATEVEAAAMSDDGNDYSSLNDAAAMAASKSGICISVYEISMNGPDKSGSRVVEQHLNTFCFIHNIDSSHMLNNLYQKAVSEGGEMLDEMSFGQLFGNESDEQSENVILAKVIDKNDGRELLMLFNTELIPLDSTVTTIRIELLYISIILIVFAVILSLILSNHMSKPLREMSGEAAKLALGDYNVNFDGGNCTETDNLSAALNKAAYELSRLDKMQKDLIANVSHDLRTPLTMIAGYTEAMRDLPGEATPENMQIVIDETNRLTTLVNDMLEVSRYQNGTQKLNKTRFNFTNVIRTTIERYAKLREKDGYIITFESDRDVFVEADEQRILQVIYNLIGNAVNYVGDDKTVIIRQTVDNNEVMTEIIDHGIGIPEDQLPMVWERYYKVNDFHKRANIGTGLGLSIVKNILLLHGAQFGVKSKVGEGSNFWFKLAIYTDSSENK